MQREIRDRNHEREKKQSQLNGVGRKEREEVRDTLEKEGWRELERKSKWNNI